MEGTQLPSSTSTSTSTILISNLPRQLIRIQGVNSAATHIDVDTHDSVYVM